MPPCHESDTETGSENPSAPRPDPKGLLLIDKPEGVTSHDVVDSVRRMLRGVRCGHAGTLDPFATGLLLVAAGPPTRLLRFLSTSEKSYEGLIRLGFATDTDDRTGRALEEARPVDVVPSVLEQSIASLSGSFDQIPPDYSARKHEGIPHYKRARRGQRVEKKPVRVCVRWEECSSLAPDLLRVRMTVSAGTYVRALARDLGSRLGCGGHLAELRRLRSGPYEVGRALPFPSTPSELAAAMIPPEAIPLGLPTMLLSEESARRIRSGCAIPFSDAEVQPGEAGPGNTAAPPDLRDPSHGPGSGPGVQRKSADGSDLPRTEWTRLIGPDGRLIGLGEIEHAGEEPGARRIQPRIVF